MSHFLHFFYLGHPWYAANVWGNVFVIAIVGPLGWLWSKTKFWPLRPMHHALQRLEAHHQKASEHDEWAARQLAHMHLEITGRPVDQHPHHPDIGGGDHEPENREAARDLRQP